MSGSPHNSRLGDYGERLAARHLAAQGMVLVERNWRCELGELDLVLRDGDGLVCCEVKTRSSAAYGHPLEAVGAVKAARLRRLAERWLEERWRQGQGQGHGNVDVRMRIDVVGVLLRDRGAPEIEHVRGVA